MKKCQQNNWVMNPFQDTISTRPTKADEELIDISEDKSLKLKFNCNNLIQFWLLVQQTCLFLSAEALKDTAPFLIFI